MPAPEGKFRTRRHPRCPECRYDLVATVDAGHLVCPECGYEFELYELHGEKRPGDWTPMIGLRRAAVSLVLRSLLLLPMWVAILWAMMALMSRFSRFNAMILPLVGIGLGYGLSRGLTDRAGFTSPVLMGMAWLAAALNVWAGISITDLITPMSSFAEFMSAGLCGIAAGLWILKVMVLDD